MAKLVKPLTATQVSNAKPRDSAYKLFDGGGLFLQVTPSGGKHWKMKYVQANGKESLLTFGGYPALSLEQARRMRDEAKSKKAIGLDPGEVRRQEKTETASLAKNTFGAITKAWLELARTKVTKETLRQYRGVIERNLLPELGDMPVKNLKPADFLNVIRKIEGRDIVATAKKATQLCSQIMQYSIASGIIEIDPVPSIRILLKPHRVKHRSAVIDNDALGDLLYSIDRYTGTIVVKSAMRIMPYVFVRTIELTQAKWSDINFETCEWRYTVSKTKTPHIVPLAPQVINILEELRKFSGSGEYVFPNIKDATRPMNHISMIAALRYMGVGHEEMTIHGFRATARTLLDEVLGERYDLIEHQLAHNVRDPNGRAYNRTAHLTERKRMMTRWADYLDSLREKARERNPEPKYVPFALRSRKTLRPRKKIGGYYANH